MPAVLSGCGLPSGQVNAFCEAIQREKAASCDDSIIVISSITLSFLLKCCVDGSDGYKYLLEEIHELFDFTENGTQIIPREIRSTSKRVSLNNIRQK